MPPILVLHAFFTKRTAGSCPSGRAFSARFDGFHAIVEKEGTILIIPSSTAGEGSSTRLTFAGSSLPSSIDGISRTNSTTNYLLGPTEDSWFAGVDNYHRVVARKIYPGIDVEFHSSGDSLEFDFVLQPGADPSLIKMRIDGAQSPERLEDGDLYWSVNGNDFVQRAPVAWQDVSDRRVPVQVDHIVDGGLVSLAVGQYDDDHPLIIDPVVEYASFYGGSGDDRVNGIGVDAADNIYVVGTTTSETLATNSAYQTENPQTRRTIEVERFCSPECLDVDPKTMRATRSIVVKRIETIFVTKFAPDGKTVLYSTYFRAQAENSTARPLIGINSVGVSPAGEVAFALSSTTVPDLPIFNPHALYDPAQQNMYVAKLNTLGSGLRFGTYLQGGTNYNLLRGLAVGSSGQVAVTGTVWSGNSIPQVLSIPGQSCTITESIPYEGFVTLFDPSGNVSLSTCIGGDDRPSRGAPFEGLRAVDIGADGDLYVAGYSSRTDFPTVNALQPDISYPDSRDATIAIIDTDFGELAYSTYFGPLAEGAAATDFEDGSFSLYHYQQYFPYDIKVDSNGDIVFLATTHHLYHPVVNAAFPNLNHPKSSYNSNSFGSSRPEFDFFLAKISPQAGIVFSTYLGGSGAEESFPVLALDAADNIYVLGISRSSDFPVADQLYTPSTEGWSPYVSRFTPDGKLAFSTALGLQSDRFPTNPGGIVVNSNGRVIVATSVVLSEFVPTTLDAVQPMRLGGEDVGLVIIDPTGDLDTDGDGVSNSADAFPIDINEYRDTDLDGDGNEMDIDDDEDGVNDVDDLFPLDASEWADADMDGAGDNRDMFDNNPMIAFDLDVDGNADFINEPDIDGDEVPNSVDAFDYDPALTTDIDGDGLADEVDQDIDGDDVENALDPYPSNPSRPLESFNFFDPTLSSGASFFFDSPLPEGFTLAADGDASWTIDQSTGFNGSRSLGSLPIADGQSARVRFVQSLFGGTLSFVYRVDSEEGADVFEFYINGERHIEASGDIAWTEFSMQLPSGNYEFEWRYSKDSEVSSGEDAAWIDQFMIPEVITQQLVFSNGFEQ